MILMPFIFTVAEISSWKLLRDTGCCLVTQLKALFSEAGGRIAGVLGFALQQGVVMYYFPNYDGDGM